MRKMSRGSNFSGDAMKRPIFNQTLNRLGSFDTAAEQNNTSIFHQSNFEQHLKLPLGTMSPNNIMIGESRSPTVVKNERLISPGVIFAPNNLKQIFNPNQTSILKPKPSIQSTATGIGMNQPPSLKQGNIKKSPFPRQSVKFNPPKKIKFGNMKYSPSPLQVPKFVKDNGLGIQTPSNPDVTGQLKMQSNNFSLPLANVTQTTVSPLVIL